MNSYLTIYNKTIHSDMNSPSINKTAAAGKAIPAAIKAWKWLLGSGIVGGIIGYRLGSRPAPVSQLSKPLNNTALSSSNLPAYLLALAAGGGLYHYGKKAYDKYIADKKPKKKKKPQLTAQNKIEDKLKDLAI